MQEVEKLKVLQSEREALKTRIKQKEHEKKASARAAGLSSMMTSSTAARSGVPSTMIRG